MWHSISQMQGFTLRATDGDIGHVDDFLFDDQHWTVRYLVIDTGGWLSGRQVLVSPISVQAVYDRDQTITVDLTREQVEHSPGIESDLPISRQKEAEFANYYGYAPYWGGVGVWGAGAYPALLHPAVAPVPAAPPVPPASSPPVPDRSETTREGLPSATPASSVESTEANDQHLRSAREVIGYTIQASDGSLGHVEDFLLDDETWTVRYMVIDTRDWWPGKQVLVAPRWIGAVNWAETQVSVDLPRDTIKGAPEYDPSQPLSRDYEAELHRYYHRPTYWDAPHS